MNANEKLIVDKIKTVIDSFPFDNYLSPDFPHEALTLVTSVVNILGDFKGKLLDIGSGSMNFTAVFAKCGFDCYAVDDLNDPWHLIGNNVNLLKKYASDLNITFHRQDPSDYTIPFEKESFDVVMLNAVIEHLHESPRNLLNAAFEFTKPQGIVVVTMPNSVNLRKRLSVLLGKTNYPDIKGFYHSKGTWRGHIREYTLAETVYILKEVGGEVILSKTFHLNINSKLTNRVVRKIYELITAVVPTLRDGILVIARKPLNWNPDVFNEDEYWKSISNFVPKGVILKN
ncbi:MAG: class I SAM-dependent methyltransferase [Cyanobacteriota bacterium]